MERAAAPRARRDRREEEEKNARRVTDALRPHHVVLERLKPPLPTDLSKRLIPGKDTP